jgi:hypothetical protein
VRRLTYFEDLYHDDRFGFEQPMVSNCINNPQKQQHNLVKVNGNQSLYIIEIR